MVHSIYHVHYIKIQAHPVLRWGQSFDDPVHIDDYLNGKDRETWDALYYINQAC